MNITNEAEEYPIPDETTEPDVEVGVEDRVSGRDKPDIEAPDETSDPDDEPEDIPPSEELEDPDDEEDDDED